jgi:hypothetical protein
MIGVSTSCELRRITKHAPGFLTPGKLPSRKPPSREKPKNDFFIVAIGQLISSPHQQGTSHEGRGGSPNEGQAPQTDLSRSSKGRH